MKRSVLSFLVSSVIFATVAVPALTQAAVSVTAGSSTSVAATASTPVMTNLQKRLLTLPTKIAQEATRANRRAAASSSVASNVDWTCLQTAIDARETALDTGIVSFNTSIASAYTVRAAALHSAYGLSTAADIRAAVKTAWSTFTKSKTDARIAWSKSRLSAWTTFEASAKTCKATQTDISSENAASDE